MINLRDIVHQKARLETKKSWQWFELHVRQAAAKMSVQRFLGDNQAHQVDRFQLGQMIFFMYDPKTKETMEFYDTCPLIFPIPSSKPDGKHFYGINLHYMTPIERGVLLSELQSYVDDGKMGPNAKMKATWETLKKFTQIEGCVKKYLFGHVKTMFVVIPPKEWEFVVWLPIERFKSKKGDASNEHVWSTRNNRYKTK